MKSACILAALFCAAALPAQAQSYIASTSTDETGHVTTQTFSSSRVTPVADPSLARDGCINVPGVAHSSADCSVMTWMDPNTVLPTKPLAELSGAEENLVRSYNILVRGGQNGVSQRAARAKSIRQ